MAVVSLDTINSAAEGVLGDVIDLRRRVHAEPEIGLDLPATQAKVVEALEGLGLEIELGTKQSSVVATLRGASGGKTILLRGDMDALPMPEDTGLDFASTIDNTMHACGHDSHVAMLFGAAKVLSGMSDQLAGTVKFLFQPGEEGYGGAAVALSEGLLDSEPIDGAFAVHIDPTVPAGSFFTRPGVMMASADEVFITVTGQGGHASAPHLAVDPIVAAASIVSELQTVVTRSVDVLSPAVITITSIHGGTTSNVIPETVELMGTLRTLSPGTRSKMQESIKSVASSVAATHGCAARTTIDGGYPVTINDAGFTNLVIGVLGELAGEEAVAISEGPLMGAEDWSYILERVPGCMVFMGVKPDDVDPEGAPACHSNRMIIKEEAMVVGVAAHCAVAISFLGQD